MKLATRIQTAALTITAAALVTPGATAQDTVDIGFKSVGRGQPLSTGVHDAKEVGPAWMGGFFPGRPRTEQTLDGFRPGNLPEGIEPLPTDVFTSNDFYADKALWSDPHYFRCNSPAATEMQRGIVFPECRAPSTDCRARSGSMDDRIPLRWHGIPRTGSPQVFGKATHCGSRRHISPRVCSRGMACLRATRRILPPAG
jgi:hypothetical protein